MFDGSRGFLCKWMLLVILVGVSLRLIIGALLTYNYDIFSWALIIANIQEGSGLYEVTGYNYTPVWGHFLAIIGNLTNLFGMDVLAERFPELIFTEYQAANNHHLAYTTTVEFNTLIAGVIAVFDILVSYLIYLLVKEVFKDEKKALTGAMIWMLCPFTIVVGAVGAMFDSLSGAMVLLCILLLIKDHEFLAGSIFAVAVFLKVFPGFLFFIFIAYIVVKHRDDYIQRISKAAGGALLFTAIIMMPHILDGHVLDSLSFMTSRASAPAEDLGTILDKYATILVYVAILIAEVVIASRFLKNTSENVDVKFIFFAFAATMTTIIYPSTPQYVLYAAPLLIIAAICIDRAYWIPLTILMVGTTEFELCSSASLLTSLMEYSDILSYDTWYSFNKWLIDTEILGINMYNVLSYIGGTLQFIGVLSAICLLLRKYIPFERLKINRATSG